MNRLGELNPSYKHGQSRRGKHTKEYDAWQNMKSRVKGTSKHFEKHYKNRGIKVCQEWYEDFEKFLSDVGEAPTPKHSLDRINNNGNYEPNNVRWATPEEQANNKRDNTWLEYDGKRQTISMWSKELGIDVVRICMRLKRGWGVEKTLTTPVVRRKS